MHPYLTQAIAAERTADFRRAAAASRRARYAVAASRAANHQRGGQPTLSRRLPVAGKPAAEAACKSSVSRAA
jgi:hypothetical protein